MQPQPQPQLQPQPQPHQFPTTEELVEQFRESQEAFKTAQSLKEMPHSGRFVSETQDLILRIRAVKRELAQMRKDGESQYAIGYALNELHELRTGYKSAKAEDKRRNEFVMEAYEGNPPEYALSVIVDWE